MNHSTLFGYTALFFAFSTIAIAQDKTPEKLNVLLIAVDDLRPALGCFGDTLAQTPNIDRLAASGMRFDRAYCQQAVCSPSRNSLLTGIRPETMKIHDLGTNFRTSLPDAVTLPEQFKVNGYTTATLGKIFHTGHGNHDDTRSWSELSKPGSGQKATAGATKDGQKDKASQTNLSTPNAVKGTSSGGKKHAGRPPAEALDVDANALQDGEVANAAIAKLGALKDAPFFLAVGFVKPHLPFVSPKKYWDQFDRAKFSAPRYRTPPKGTPEAAYHGPGELVSYEITKEQLTDDKVCELIHGYYAATAYMDAQVGRVLGELDRLGLANRTIVVLWGDHGYQLGEHGEWAKHNTTELSTHIPIIVRAPGKTTSGTSTRALVETVDIYPSLCELAGLPIRPELEGRSFVPLLADPARNWKTAAFSVWPMRQNQPNGKRKDQGLARAMRTERYRFVEWGNEFELYDHQSDPDEHVNLAVESEQKELVARLRDQLAAGWRGALPK